MKKIVYLFTLVALVALFSCDNDDVTPVKPSNISNVGSEALPGQIKLTWDLPEDKNLEYVQVTYFDHLAQKDMMRLASVYSDSIIIPNTRQKYGDYDFALQPYSSTDTPGELIQFRAKSGPAPKTVSVINIKSLSLKAEDLFTDAQEPSEGPLANIIDGNTETYFHAAWSVDKGPLPHYIVVKLPKKVNGIKFSYTTRAHTGTGNHPKEMNVYVTKDFDGTTYDVSSLTPLAVLSNLPNGSAKVFDSDEFILDDEYQYVWLQVKSTYGDTKFFAMSEFSISELLLKVVDPEASDDVD